MKMPSTIYKIQYKYYCFRIFIWKSNERETKITSFKRIDWDDDTLDETWTPDTETQLQSSTEEDETEEVELSEEHETWETSTDVDEAENLDPHICIRYCEACTYCSIWCMVFIDG